MTRLYMYLEPLDNAVLVEDVFALAHTHTAIGDGRQTDCAFVVCWCCHVVL